MRKIAAVVAVRDDGASINSDWLDQSPDPLVQRDHFSARWTRSVSFAAGSYRFDIFHDDGARLYIDDFVTPKFENWCSDCLTTDSVPVPLAAGVHNLKLEMYENAGWAAAQLSFPLLRRLPPPTCRRPMATTVTGYGSAGAASLG